MKTPLVDRISFAKIVTVLGVTCLVSVGLCGAGVAFSSGGNRAGLLGNLSGLMLVSGTVTFWLSLLGLAVIIPLWIVLALIAGPARNEAPRPFYDSDDRDKPGGT